MTAGHGMILRLGAVAILVGAALLLPDSVLPSVVHAAAVQPAERLQIAKPTRCPMP
ncbi:hypothetical protein [Nocardia sp. NPDC020380]|uniref:hypothetical protein n=1 Tax=Nocardia sp. NPDC020380 TaxID=3364309 RepID=UPI00379D1A38